MRYIAAAAAFVATLWLVCMAAVFALISAVGPHSASVSKPVEILIYMLCGAAVLVLPILAAKAAWRRSGGRDAASQETHPK